MILQLRATKYFWTGLRIPILLRTRPIIILYVRDMCKVCTYIVDNICIGILIIIIIQHDADAETFDVLWSRVYAHMRCHRYIRLRLESKTTIIYYVIIL
jgi:hypothetical protein